MKSRARNICNGLLFTYVLSSCILFILVSCLMVGPEIDEKTTFNNTSQKPVNNVSSTEEQKDVISIKEKDVNSKNSVITHNEDHKLDPIHGKEFIFSDSLSQNSGVSAGGLAETGQPVLITLVDTAAAELTNSILEQIDPDSISTNNTVLEFESNVVKLDILHSVDNITNETVKAHNESQGEIKKEYIVRAIPKEKEDDRLISEKIVIKDNDTNDNSTIVVAKSDNVTVSDTETVAKPEVVNKPSEVQEEIPSFAEWAQKQLEEAEKNKETGVNHSSQSPQGTPSAGVGFKMRSKNYASPDCGAKIVAANPEAGSAGFILSPSRDEYMLNTCNSRIWFIVELCEAIQAKKVDLANFELFSSTPKNFSVYVSDRFPTREWASVGQFIAKEERDIQTFNLHPHLFGKFIKVELHSHYGSEHYCPISLFRVYGTSEFEVFETENSPHAQSNQVADDDDDDILEDGTNPEKQDLSRNLFGSARDAVMSIMKKAAQVLVKGSDSKNSSELSESSTTENKKCKTPSHIIVCDNCSNSLFTNVYDLMSCHSNNLNVLIETPLIRNTLCNTEICQQFGLDFKSKKTSSVKTDIASYMSALLLPGYVAALCNMLAIIEKKVVLNNSYETDLNVTTNLTIDKKVQKVSEDGSLNELLQKPFDSSCSDENDPLCKNKINDKQKPDIVPTVKYTSPPDVIGGNILDIKPTKTLSKDTDKMETSSSIESPSAEDLSSKERRDQNASEKLVIESSMGGSFQQETVNTDNTNDSEKLKMNESIKVTDNTIKHDSKQDLPSVTVSQEINNSDAGNGSMDTMDEANLKLSTQDQISLDNLLKELEQASSDSATPSPPNNAAPSHQGQGQKESVFLRLSNRIKALERNMSLSSQYLEELSRRYKKQMEEMQRTFEKTLVTMSEEGKRAEERDQKNSDDMMLLQQQIVQLSTVINNLLLEQDSLFGNLSLPKFLFLQLIITVFTIYLMQKYYSAPQVLPPERKLSKVKNNKDKTKMRRKSTEAVPGNIENHERTRKRRPSEEALNITRTATEKRENIFLKVEKKKRKRKSPIVQRSYSIAAPSEAQLADIQHQISSQDEQPWRGPDVTNCTIDMPIALEEAEFIIPETEPIDFNKLGEMKVPSINGVTPKKEFPKTNGSIFGKKSPDIGKIGKVRRLSSPSFFRAALNRSSSSSGTPPSVGRTISPVREVSTGPVIGQREVRSEERTFRSSRMGTESPQLSSWSSFGDVSEGSVSARTDPQCSKKKKSKNSFKNMLKKVF